MTERKTWTSQEDEILRKIVSHMENKQWSRVAKIMEEEYGISGRTGKQCRQRWYNQLNPDINNEDWTPEEEQNLFYHHNMYGNKWSKLSSFLPGRTDNNIKNHFYCTLRRAARRVNRYLADPLHKAKIKQITNVLISKIVAVAEQKYMHPQEQKENQQQEPENLVSLAYQIKNLLLSIAGLPDTAPEASDKLSMLVDGVHEFTSQYKKKKFKKRRKAFSCAPEDSDEDSLVLPSAPSTRRPHALVRPCTSLPSKRSKSKKSSGSPLVGIEHHKFGSEIHQSANSPSYMPETTMQIESAQQAISIKQPAIRTHATLLEASCKYDDLDFLDDFDIPELKEQISEMSFVSSIDFSDPTEYKLDYDFLN